MMFLGRSRWLQPSLVELYPSLAPCKTYGYFNEDVGGHTDLGGSPVSAVRCSDPRGNETQPWKRPITNWMRSSMKATLEPGVPRIVVLCSVTSTILALILGRCRFTGVPFFYYLNSCQIGLVTVGWYSATHEARAVQQQDKLNKIGKRKHSYVENRPMVEILVYKNSIVL